MIPKEVVIHIGIHKTGSTSIQNSMAGYDDGLSFYAELGSANHSHFFQTQFESGNFSRHWKRLGRTEAEIGELVGRNWATLAGQQYRKGERVIYSGENISEMPRDALTRMKDYFENLGSTPKIIVFLREPLSLTASFAQECVKQGYLPEGPFKHNQPLSMGVSKKLENYFDVFGRSNIQILDFADAIKHPRGVVGAFADALRLDLSRIPVLPPSNESLGATAFKLLIRFYRTGALHNVGPMLFEVRWEFIDTLNRILSEGREDKLDKLAFHGTVDWSDFREVDALVGKHHYSISECSASMPLSSYCEEIDFDFADKRLKEHFEKYNFGLPQDVSTDQLVVLLFYQILREHAARPLRKNVAKMREEIATMNQNLLKFEKSNRWRRWFRFW